MMHASVAFALCRFIIINGNTFHTTGLCEGKPSVTSGGTLQSVMQNYVSFDISMNKLLQAVELLVIWIA